MNLNDLKNMNMDKEPDFNDLFDKAAKAQTTMVKRSLPLIAGIMACNVALFCGGVYFIFWCGHKFGAW